MPKDVLSRPTWAHQWIQSWSVVHTLKNERYDELVKAIRAIGGGAFCGVIRGLSDLAEALIFVHRGTVCGARVNDGNQTARDALSQIAAASSALTWTFRRAPERFADSIPIVASLLGGGQRELRSEVNPTMSAHLEALAELEKSSANFLLLEPSESPEREWIIFSTGPGRTHRFVVGPDSVELPTEEGMSAETLIAVFRRQKTTGELYRAVPRPIPDEALAAPSARDAALRTASTARPSKGNRLLYAFPLAVALLAGAGWLLWGGVSSVEPTRQPERPSSPLGEPAGAPSALGARREEMKRLRAEMAALRAQTEPATSSTSAKSPAASKQTAIRSAPDAARLDSLKRRITTLEAQIQHAAMKDRSATSSPQAASPRTAEEPTGGPNRAEASAQPPAEKPNIKSAERTQARAYTETLVDIPPEATYTPSPPYPPSFSRGRIAGPVLVSVLVGKNGAVRQAISLRGEKALRGAALDAVKGWRFRPAQLDGKAVPCWKTVAVTFRAD